MKQVFLSGQGQVELIEAPVPAKRNGTCLVANSVSLISSGTEGAAVTKNDGLLGLYEKAVSSKDKLEQVWVMAQTQGISTAKSAIQAKLSDYTAIGYSTAGVIVENAGVPNYRVGDRVACMGAGIATHSEYAAVPKNLMALIPQNVSDYQATFAALSCIAMQGIRRLELSPGEKVVVVGLGLIGQLTVRLAAAMGYSVCGTDISLLAVKHAIEHTSEQCFLNDSAGAIKENVSKFTNGVMADGVIICASAKTDDILNDSFDLCRKRGRISIVGDIGLSIERAKIYAKELEVRISCSYGVGRYDTEYELNGVDYPLPYVRWTEQRNLEFFLELLSTGRLNIDDLITQKFEVSNAKDAYSFLKAGNGPVFGILLDYGSQDVSFDRESQQTIIYREIPSGGNSLSLGLIGVGAYVKNVHIPNLLKMDNVTINAVASQTGASAAAVAKKVNSAYVSSDNRKILNDNNTTAVIIGTRHSSHFDLTMKALEAGKHVFVEKPLATNSKDAALLVTKQQVTEKVLRVGFNRRFAPALIAMKNGVVASKKVLNIRVNVGAISDHWSNALSEGGRLMGEGVHFFDLANWVIGSYPETISAQFCGDAATDNPDVVITLGYKNGSVATVSYLSMGNTGLGKEYYELFGGGVVIAVDDYQSIQAHGVKLNYPKRWKNEKGQFAGLQEFIDASSQGKTNGGATALDGFWATLIAEAAVVSGLEGQTKRFEEFLPVDQHDFFNEFKEV